MYVLVNAEEFLPPSIKTYDEVKGRVMGDYQGEYERQWVDTLREKYNVSINKKTLKQLEKELGS